MTRPSGRKPDQMRDVTIETGVNMHAEGSCLIKFGNTHVLCTASVDKSVPGWMRNTGKGWVTAEYGMLPRSTGDRIDREAARGKQSGRTQEIQRLIGRALRAVVDMEKMGECQIKVDCDVIQADGGTRTASITGGFVALMLAFQHMQKIGMITEIPVTEFVSAVSCGIYQGVCVSDLDYAEDSTAEADTNFVITESLGVVEVQGTAEDKPFSRAQLNELMDLAEKSVKELTVIQKAALGL
ncbi:MAG: ribonuclease PH [Micavibrio sp.]|nr:ribonuclease PH [Micavibrio sp.]